MNLEKTAVILVITILLGVIGYLIMFNISASNNKGFTELYFIDGLPKTIDTNKEYHFSFAIHNLEEKQMDYEYTVSAASKILRQGQVNLNHRDTITIEIDFTENKTGTIPISVQLLNKNQEIHFWTNIQ